MQLEAVLGRILRLKLEDPEAKILLFSEWNGVLDVVEHALRTNHINFARVKAGGCVFVHVALYYNMQCWELNQLLSMKTVKVLPALRLSISKGIENVQSHIKRFPTVALSLLDCYV